MKSLLESVREAKSFVMTVNAGEIPLDHWTQDPEVGGGRIVGEMCHFVDLMQYLTKSQPVQVFAQRVSGNNTTLVNNDNVTISLKFQDGSIASLVYSGAGDRAFSREQVVVFCEGKSVECRDFKQTLMFHKGKKNRFATRNQAMGYQQELQHFVNVMAGREAFRLPFADIFYSTLTVFKIHESIQKNEPVLD